MIKLSAPAKINAYLKITGKRLDGYHTLESLFLFVDCCDILEIQPADALKVRVWGDFKGPVDPNDTTLHKAYRLAKELKPELPGFDIVLTKNIPVGAGLGGGSGDAAAFLKFLHTEYDVPVRDIALKVGADVPSFMDGRPVLVKGIGEIIEPYDGTLERRYAVLVNPLKPLLTAQVFKEYRMERYRDNDLIPAAVRMVPEIADILAAMPDGNMTGSGSTCFKLCGSEAEMSAEHARLAELFPTYWIKSCRVI